jgi:hypothetical protein
MSDQEYYRKIPVSTPPEKEGEYDTSQGKMFYNEKYGWHYEGAAYEWYKHQKIDYYFLPIPSEDLALLNPTEYRRGLVEGEQGQMRKIHLFGQFISIGNWEYAYKIDSYRKWDLDKKGDFEEINKTFDELYNSEEFQIYLKEKGV